MDNGQHTDHAPTFREAGADELLKDLLRVGPAPNASREAFVTVVSVALLAVVVGFLRPETTVAIVLVGLVAAFTAVRWVVGAGRWRRR